MRVTCLTDLTWCQLAETAGSKIPIEEKTTPLVQDEPKRLARDTTHVPYVPDDWSSVRRVLARTDVDQTSAVVFSVCQGEDKSAPPEKDVELPSGRRLKLTKSPWQWHTPIANLTFGLEGDEKSRQWQKLKHQQQHFTSSQIHFRRKYTTSHGLDRKRKKAVLIKRTESEIRWSWE